MIKYFYSNIIEYIRYIHDIGIRFWIFRKFVKKWTNEKIIKKYINKEFDIIKEKVPNGYKDWFEYILKSNDDNWFRKYHFSTKEQEYELMKFYYKIVKLHYSEYGFTSDSLIYRMWPMDSLMYGFSIHKKDEIKYDINNYNDITKYSYNSILWQILLFLIFGKIK